MTQLEDRLRQELQDLAKRAEPARLRPLSDPPPRARPGSTGWLIPAAAAAVILLVIAGAALAGRSLGPGASSAASGPAGPGDPPSIAVSMLSPQGTAASIKLMSPVTGRIVRSLAALATGNGFALSPDSKSVFVVGPAGRKIEIRRISVATGQVTFVASGVYPAVSPDSRRLAYATGAQFTKLAIRDLRTGGTRTIDLEQLIGRNATLLNQGGVTWLGDGTQVVAIPQPDAESTSSGGTATPVPTSEKLCGRPAPARQLCLIVVATGTRKLRARGVFVPLPVLGQVLISGEMMTRHVLLLAAAGPGSPGSVIRVSIGGGSVVEHQVATLPRRALPVAIAPAGDRILYLMSGRTPRLWAATFQDAKLTHQHLLYTDNSRFGVEGAAW